MKNFVKEQSFRYIATICQIIGLASASISATKVHKWIVSGDMIKLDVQSLSFKYSCITLVIGIVFLTLGWYIMYLIDKDKAELGDK